MEILLQNWTVFQFYDLNKKTFKEQDLSDLFFSTVIFSKNISS